MAYKKIPPNSDTAPDASVAGAPTPRANAPTPAQANSPLERVRLWTARHLTIRQRLALWHASLLSLILILFSVVVYTVVLNQLQGSVNDDIRGRAVAIAGALQHEQYVSQTNGGSNVLPTTTVSPGVSATVTAVPSSTSTTHTATPGGTATARTSATPAASATPASTPDPASSALIQQQLRISLPDVLGRLDLGFEVLDVHGRLKYLASTLNGRDLPVNLTVIDAALQGQAGSYTARTDSSTLAIYAQPILVIEPVGATDNAKGATSAPTPHTAPSARTPSQNGALRTPATGASARPMVVGIVLVAKPLDEVNDTLSTLSRILFIGDLIAVLLATIGGLFIAESGVRPITDVTRAARAIAINAHAAGLGTRVKYYAARDEVGELVSTFNDMLAAIEQVTTAQRRFVADASHELRAPLTTIKGSLEFLKHAPDLPEAERAALLEDAYAESERMAMLVNDLLLLARADAAGGVRASALDEQLSGRREPVEMDQLAMEVFRAARAQMLARRKELTLSVTNLEPVTVQADPGQIRQLALILLDNAIKYTPQGGKIRLSVTQNGARAAFSVTDSGIGIDPEDRPHIFERFWRADRARERDEHGSGLGLAIARWIAEAHNGEISVHSQPGQGSTFTLLLPAVRRVGEDTTAKVTVNARGGSRKRGVSSRRLSEAISPLARLAQSVSRPREDRTSADQAGHESRLLGKAQRDARRRQDARAVRHRNTSPPAPSTTPTKAPSNTKK
ncbi:MAG: HAMP domain-containing sensor histidine kinase [Ktedonobacterales bacterium]